MRKRHNASKQHTHSWERVIALMCLAGFGQPSKNCFVRPAISHALEFLNSEHSKCILHLLIGRGLSFDVTVVSRIEFEQFWS